MTSGARVTRRAATKVAKYLQSRDRRFAYVLFVSDNKEARVHMVQGGMADALTLKKMLTEVVDDMLHRPGVAEAMIRAGSSDDNHEESVESFARDDK